jgi:hypothetical protein
LTDSLAYSTWNNRPSGLKVVIPWSYPLPLGCIIIPSSFSLYRRFMRMRVKVDEPGPSDFGRQQVKENSTSYEPSHDSSPLTSCGDTGWEIRASRSPLLWRKRFRCSVVVGSMQRVGCCGPRNGEHHWWGFLDVPNPRYTSC